MSKLPERKTVTDAKCGTGNAAGNAIIAVQGVGGARLLGGHFIRYINVSLLCCAPKTSIILCSNCN